MPRLICRKGQTARKAWYTIYLDGVAVGYFFYDESSAGWKVILDVWHHCPHTYSSERRARQEIKQAILSTHIEGEVVAEAMRILTEKNNANNN